MKARNLMYRLGSRGICPRLLKLRHCLRDVPNRNCKRRYVICATLARGVVYDRHVDGGGVDGESTPEGRPALGWLGLLLRSRVNAHLRR